MESSNLKLISLLHDLTQLDYRVYFSDDFNGMVTVSIEDGFFENGINRHYHCGFPDGPRDRLEEDVINSLSSFLNEVKEKADEAK